MFDKFRLSFFFMSGCQVKAILSYKKQLDQMYHINIHLLKQHPPHCTFLVLLYKDCLFVFLRPYNSMYYILSIKIPQKYGILVLVFLILIFLKNVSVQ